MNTFAPDYPNNNGIYNQNGGMQGYDPSMFTTNGQNLDVNRAPMQNGSISPAFPNQGYQVNPVIPSKRPRPSEDNTSASPRPGSRSQTPHVPYPGFQGNPLQAPTPFQHLQQTGSQNATPSPTMQPQQFRPPGGSAGGPPQRVNTNSPNPGPYPQQNMGMSPPPNGQQGRVNTPQNPNMGQMGQMAFMPGQQMQPGFNPQFGAQPGMQQNMQGNMPVLPPHLQKQSNDAQRAYQMRMQNHQQNLAATNMATQQQRAAGMNAMYGGQGHPQGMPPHQGMPHGTMPSGMPAPGGQPQQEVQQFLAKVQSINHRYNKPFNPTPAIQSMPTSLAKIWSAVTKAGGHNAVTQRNMWSQVAAMIGFNPQQFPMAAQEVKFHYEAYLMLYEQVLNQSKRLPGQGAQMMGAPGGQSQMSPGLPRNMTPGAMTPQQQQQYMQQMQRPQSGQPDQMTPARPLPAQSTNGWTTPQPAPTPTRPEHAMNQQRKSLSRPMDATPPHGQAHIPTPSPSTDAKGFDRAPTSEPVEHLFGAPVNGQLNSSELQKKPHGTNYVPNKREVVPKEPSIEPTHGGVAVGVLSMLADEIVKTWPRVPHVEEMGVIDVRTIKLSIESGVHHEVRNALDTLARLTNYQQWSFELERSEDLIDVLIDCAQDQVDVLVEGSSEDEEAVKLPSYEDIMRECRQEIVGVQDVPDFESDEYILQRAADRLISITVILRNLSFFELNHRLLSSPNVISFIAKTIRLIGTRSQLLRSHVNTTDFMKDIITFLSNTAHKIELPSRDEALYILQFLLTFAPCPAPSSAPLRFTSFDPTIHKYLPAAVDCLAKLLAQDEPNRAYYKAIFNNDATSSPPYSLLTRSFALAISVLPDRTSRNASASMLPRVSEIRKPYLTQGMLAADILASLAPGAEIGLARSWLEAEDGWAQSLVRTAFRLLEDPPAPPLPPGHGRGPPPRQDTSELGFHLMTHRALNMLRRLAEKSGTEDQPMPSVAAMPGNEQDDADDGVDDNQSKTQLSIDFRGASSLIMQIETLIGALIHGSVDAVGLNKLVKLGDIFE